MSRLNPFPFPSETSLRFGLLIIFVLCGSFRLSGNLWWVFHGVEHQKAGACASALSPLGTLKVSDLQNQQVMHGVAEDMRQKISQCASLLRPQKTWQFGGVVLTVSLALGIYWFFPSWKIWRERLQPLSAEELPEVADELQGLCQKAALSSYPSFVWNPLKLDFPSAFGRRGQYYVALSGAFITRFFYTDRAAFRAIILHELAHLRHADVDKTYATIAVSLAFLAVALVPAALALAVSLAFLVMAFVPSAMGDVWSFVSGEFITDMLMQLASSTVLVTLAGVGVLRVREYYADVRASVWDATTANLDRALAALPSVKAGRWRQIFHFHPAPSARQHMLKDTSGLFRLSFWDALGIGIAAWVAIDIVQPMVLTIFAPHVSHLQSFMLLWLVTLLGVPLCLMAMAVGAVGIAVWRETFAVLIRGQRTYSAGRLGFALALGFVYTSGTFVVAAIAGQSLRSEMGAFTATTKVFGAVVILISLFLLFKWLAAAVSAWLEVVLHSHSPRPVLFVSIAIAIGLAVAWGGMAGWTSIFYLLIAGNQHFVGRAVSIYLHNLIWGLPICLSSVMLWAFPLAAWFWRKRAASTSSSPWAFLDGPSAVPRQVPLCPPGLALRIGVAMGSLFCVLLALVSFRDALPSDIARHIGLFYSAATQSLAEAYGSDMEGVIIWGPAAMLQAIAAAIVASGITRLGVLYGMFAAFIAGLVIALGNYVLMVLIAGMPQSLYEALHLSALFLGTGTLLAWPIALAVAAIAARVPPASLHQTRLWVGGSIGVACGAVLLFFFLFRPPPPTPQMLAQDFIKQGEAKFSAQDYQGALADFTQAILLNPKNAVAYKDRAYTHSQLHDYAAALADLTQAILLKPADTVAFKIRAQVYYALHNYQEMRRDLTQVIFLNPKDAVAYNDRGSAHYQLHDYGAALADYTQALALNPTYALAYSNRAEAHSQLRDYGAALADYTQALTLNPTEAPVYHKRAYAHYQLHDYRAALADLTQALTLNPTEALAYHDRGKTHAALRDYGAALVDYTQALTLNPTYALAYFNRAEAHSQLRDYGAALADYTQVITLNPTEALIYNERGVAYYQLRDYGAALADYTQAITLNPAYALAYLNRGSARTALRDYAAALVDYTQAITLNPTYALTYNERGNAHFQLRDYAAALADYTQAITLNPQDAAAYLNRGNAHSQLRDYRAALVDYTQVITINPTAAAYHKRAYTHYQLHDYRAALVDYTQAITLNPAAALTYNDRGGAHYQLHDYGAALADYTQAITLNPTEAVAYLNRGKTHAALHNYAAALADYTQAITLNPTDALTYNERGNAHYQLHDYGAALVDYTQVITLNPTDALAYLNRGATHEQLRDYAAALADYTQAITLNPTAVAAYHKRAYAYEQLHDYGAALVDYTQAITLNPTDALAYLNRGFAYREQGALDRAIADFDKAIELDPQSALAYLDRGFVYEEQGALDRAIADFDKAIELDPQSALAYLGRGFAYREQRALDRAIADFDKAIELDPNESAGWRNRALSRGLTGDHTGAQKDLAQALHLQPTNARTLYISGILQELTGNMMGAMSDFTQAQQMTHNAEEWKKIEKALSHFRPKH